MVKGILQALRELRSEPQKHEHKVDVTLHLKTQEGVGVREYQRALNVLLEDVMNG